jgi:two-component system, OmpR family, response regulator
MRVLLVEDDVALAERLKALLNAGGFAVHWHTDGIAAEFAGQTEDYDAVVLDLGLQGMDGISVLHRWREAKRHMPVLILTARGRWHDKLAGFNAGADDYLTKPFEPEELKLRLHALIRRSAGHGSPLLTCGRLSLDVNTGHVRCDASPVTLTAQEGRILAYLMHHQHRVVSRTELGEHVYDNGYDSDSNVIDVLIGRIRRKLCAPGIIKTVRGRGFQLDADA